MHSQQQQSERSTRLISVDHQTQIVSKPSIGHSLNLKSSSEAGGFGLKWSWPNLAASWCTCWHNNSFTRDIQTMKWCEIHHYKDFIGFQRISWGKLVMICDDHRLLNPLVETSTLISSLDEDFTPPPAGWILAALLWWISVANLLSFLKRS